MKVTYYKLLNYTQKKTFVSLEDLNDFLKDKIHPNNEDEWEVEVETVHTIKIPVSRRPVKNANLLQKLIDNFVEKASTRNVKNGIDFGKTKYKDEYSKYKDTSNDKSQLLFYAIDLGLSQKIIDKIYNDNKIDELYPHVTLFKYCEELTGEKVLCKDINPNNYYQGILKEKYPKTYKLINERIDNIDSFIRYLDTFFDKLSDEEYLDAFKEKIKEFPLEDIKIVYNSGNYKPCNNYSLIFGKRPKNMTMDLFGYGLPNIMFRDGDIYLTNDDYIGRHVSHKYKTECDFDQNVYDYCMKNLK